MITKQDVLSDLTHKYCQYEIQLYSARYGENGWLTQDKMNQYFQSTPQKAAFSRLMYIARTVNELYSPSDIAERLHMSRTAAHKLINETVAEGWVEHCCSEANRKFYRAADVLAENLEETTSWTHDKRNELDVTDTDWLLLHIKKRERL